MQQDVDGTVTNYLWDEASIYGDVVMEFDDTGTPIVDYTLAEGQLLSQTRGATTNYYLADGQGSTRALANVSGTITDTYDYTAFGELFSSTGSTTNSYLYTGQQFDDLIGLYSLRARYYGPTIGRFLSRDTFPVNFRNPIELNRYGYAANNPINGHDPSGQVTLFSYSVESLQRGALTGVVSGGAGGFTSATFLVTLSRFGGCGNYLNRHFSDLEVASEFIVNSTINGAKYGTISGVLISLGPVPAATVIGFGIYEGFNQLAQLEDPAGQRCAIGATAAGIVGGAAAGYLASGPINTIVSGSNTGGGGQVSVTTNGITTSAHTAVSDGAIIGSVAGGGVAGGIATLSTDIPDDGNGGDDSDEDEGSPEDPESEGPTDDTNIEENDEQGTGPAGNVLTDSDGNVVLHEGNQGKHIVGHNNFNPAENRSVLTHPDPQQLLNDFSGQGNSLRPDLTPGEPGYREIVDFGQVIGYHVNLDTRVQTETTIGWITYSKTGAHIVPIHPSSWQPPGTP